MSNYNIAQKILLILGFFVFLAFIFGTLYILTERKEPKVLGASTNGLTTASSVKYTAKVNVFKNTELKTSIDVVEAEELHFISQSSQIVFDDTTYLISDDYSGFFTKYNVYASSGHFYFQNGSESWNLLTRDTAVRVLPHSQVIVDATDQEFIVINGSIIYEESKILESGQRLKFIVDNEYIYNDGHELLKTKTEFKNLGYTVYDVGLLPEVIDFMAPEIIY